MKSTALLTLLPVLAFGQTATLPEINVTGSRQRADEKENPAATKIKVAELPGSPGPGSNYQDIIAAIPGAYSGNPIVGNFSLRGVGQDSLFNYLNTGSNPLIVVLEQGIPLSPTTLRLMPPLLWNLESAEIYRGAQSQLPGPNAIGGALVLKNAAPSPVAGGRAMIEVGEDGLFRSGLTQNLPLITNELELQVSAFHQENDGYESNISPDVRHAGATERNRFESTLRWLPGRDAESHVDFSLIYDRFRGNPAATVKELPDHGFFDRKNQLNPSPQSPAERWASVINASIQLPDDRTLESTTGIQRLDTENFFDLDGTRFLDWYSTGFIDELRFTEDLALRGTNGPLAWRIGAYYEQSRYEGGYDGVGGFPFAFPFRNDASEDVRVAALSGRLDWEAVARWHVIGGLRINHEKRELDVSSTLGPLPKIKNSASVSETVPLPQLGVEWRPDDKTSAGLRLSRAYRAGGISRSASLGTVQTYDSEDGWEIEGFTSFQPHPSVDVTSRIFYSSIDDMQVSSDTPGGFPGIDKTVSNAASSTRYGAEVESRWAATGWLTFHGAAGWTHTRFDELTVNGIDHSGQSFPNAPEWTASIGADIRPSGDGFFGSVLYSFADSAYTSTEFPAATALEPRNLLSAKIGYSWKNASLYLFGSNLLNDEYATVRFVNNSFGAPDVSGIAAPPRVLGIGCDYRW